VCTVEHEARRAGERDLPALSRGRVDDDEGGSNQSGAAADDRASWLIHVARRSTTRATLLAGVF